MAEIRCQEIRPLWARFSGPVNRLMTYASFRAHPFLPNRSNGCRTSTASLSSRSRSALGRRRAATSAARNRLGDRTSRCRLQVP